MITSIKRIFIGSLVIFALANITSCKRCPTAQEQCMAPKIWKYNSCINDSTKGAFFNGQWVQLGTTISAGPGKIYIASGSNCGDWRDSIFMAAGNLDTNQNTFFFMQLPHSQQYPGAASCFAELSYYQWRPTRDTFSSTYALLDYHYPDLRPNRGLALRGTVNKAQDSVWLRVFNIASTSPVLTLGDYCDKVLVRVR
jgi:hypothetical protein